MTTKRRSIFGTQRLFRDTRGFTLAFAALAGSVLIGFTGLAVETGLWYAVKRVNQSVADGAALSGAMELLAGYTTSSGLTEVQQMGEYAAIKNRFTPTATICGIPTSGQISVCQCYNYTVGGTCTAPTGIQAANAVEAIVAQQQNALFASLFLPSVTINTRAVAALKILDNPCMLSLAPSGPGIEVKGSSAITTPGCSIVADSNSTTAINIHDNGGSITAGTLVTVGGVGFKGNPVVPPLIPLEFSLTSPPTMGAANYPDPYSATLSHAFDITGMPTAPPCTLRGSTWSGNCAISGASLSGSPITLTGNAQIIGPWDIKNQTVDLKPGTYWITNGDLTLDTNATVTCSTCTGGAGVTIILTKTGAGTVGDFCSVSNSSVTLNAPTTGTYAGYMVIQDPTAITGTSTCKKVLGTQYDNTFEGGPSMNLTGLLYFPKTTVAYQGNPSSTCTFLIAQTIVLNGNSNFSTSGCPSAGLNLPTVNTVSLAE